jgi:rhamnulokinase
MPGHLAIDLGAESGRVIEGHLTQGKLKIREVHRFPNQPVRVNGHLHWDILRLWHEIISGLCAAGDQNPTPPLSLGVDSWGVDFGLLDRSGNLLANPYHYRDTRTNGVMTHFFKTIPPLEIFEQTGIQFLPFNTLYQLFAMRQNQDPLLDMARHLLNIPDLINYWLSGRISNELTIASTTQCLNPREGDWAKSLLENADIPTGIFGEIIPPGTTLGPLLPDVSRDCGGIQCQVIASACHDTASAVAAAPLDGPTDVYLSSGTWSLMGVEVDHPVINEAARIYDFTNEAGYGKTFRLLKNIMGLWLIQECRRQWQREGEPHSYDDLIQMARKARPFQACIPVNDSRFLHPGDMPARIRAYCLETGQPVPATKCELLRTIHDSLALEYRWVYEKLTEITGTALNTIHIIGGGSRNRLLNQLTANATGCTVISGPVEATAIGNILIQAIQMNTLSSLTEARAWVRRSFPMEVFTPEKEDGLSEAYQTYQDLHQKGSFSL